MNWVILLLVSTLTLQGFAKQEGSARGGISRHNLSDKNVRLDPLLRRALLRALTELEKEAQEKVRAEEIRYARSEPENNSGSFDNGTQDEIQNTADSNYPSPTPNNLQSTPLNEALNSNRFEESVVSTSPATAEGPFLYQTQAPVEEEDVNSSAQESKGLSPTVNPSEIASNLISDVAEKEKTAAENTETTENAAEEKKEGKDSTGEAKKPASSDNEVDIFKAPLVAAFTLHQDSRGTPHSVIPLFPKEPQDNQRQELLQQQFQLYQQQQQQQQFLQNQFIPSVTITPLSQPNQFNQPQRFFPQGTAAPSFPSSTVFPPLVSNSILSQSFPSSVLPTQGFPGPTTLAPFRSNQNPLPPLAPQRNISPQPFQSTLLPPQDFSVVQSHNFNFSPTPQASFPPPTVAPPQGLQPISIPPVTLPLQNEPRFQAPIIVPSLQINSEQNFLNQEQQRLRNQFFIEEQNRQRLIEEQNRQRQIEEENKKKQIEEQNRQRQIEEQRRQQQRQELNRQRQVEEERARLLAQQNLHQESQLRQQRQEQGVDFQRSVGFSFNHNLHGLSKPQNNAFSFHIQPSQSFGPSLNFGDVESRNRVNRQEGFGSTGNLGIVNNQGQRNFPQNQFQSNQIFSNFQGPQEYRTIPEEHYRNLPINQFQQANRFQQFRQQPNNFQQNNVQDVNKQLQKLLFQSGVATDVSGQEDLNIVSKVLALNHERSDPNVEETILRNERRADDSSDKSLGVGEIKDVQVTTEFLKTQ